MITYGERAAKIAKPLAYLGMFGKPTLNSATP